MKWSLSPKLSFLQACQYFSGVPTVRERKYFMKIIENILCK